LAVGLAAGCAGDGDGGDDAPNNGGAGLGGSSSTCSEALGLPPLPSEPPRDTAGQSPVEICEGVVRAYCDMQARCNNTLTFDECKSDLANTNGIDCAFAGGPGPCHSDCLFDLENLPCGSAGRALACDEAIQMRPPPEGRLNSCFQTAGFANCGEYCESVGKTCDESCSEAVGLTGLEWGTPGTCPDDDAGRIVVTSCKGIFVYPEARCCCA
jgi:hypothetical protein